MEGGAALGHSKFKGGPTHPSLFLATCSIHTHSITTAEMLSSVRGRSCLWTRTRRRQRYYWFPRRRRRCHTRELGTRSVATAQHLTRLIGTPALFNGVRARHELDTTVVDHPLSARHVGPLWWVLRGRHVKHETTVMFGMFGDRPGTRSPPNVNGQGCSYALCWFR